MKLQKFFFFLSFSFFFFFLEQRAPRERAPSSELRLEGKGVKRTRETVVPFAMLKRKETLKLKNKIKMFFVSVENTCFLPFCIRMFPNRAGD